MFLRIGWYLTPDISGSGANGTTESGRFVVVGSIEEGFVINRNNTLWDSLPSGEGRERIEPALPSSTSPTHSLATSIASSTHSSTGELPTGADGNGGTGGEGGNAGSTDAAGSDEDGDGGLSTGAIVGIAIGGLAGLILIAALIWFLLRRRRRRNPEKSLEPNGPAVDSGTYAMNKEMSRVTDSPHTPRSTFPTSGPISGSAAAAQQSDGPAEERPYSPYRQVVPSGSRQELTRSGAATPQGLPSNVAHLVEDGMTDDEIRRLEEEERQLDDEIARARRRY